MGQRRQKTCSSLFAALPIELRSTLTANVAATKLLPPPLAAPLASSSVAGPSTSAPASQVPSPSPASSSKQIPQKRARQEEDEQVKSVVIKRRRPWSEENDGGNRTHPWDCTGMVQRYTKLKNVPEELKKYFYQRTRLFSMYNELPMLLDTEGWFSVTPERIAIQIAERLRCGTILDAFCGVGGNAIAFAQTCERVIALDTSPTRLALARHNALQYGVADRIEFLLCDFTTFARSLSASSSSQTKPLNGIDVVFLSPPWGGISYLSFGTPSSTPLAADTPNPLEEPAPPSYPLSAIQPLHGKELFEMARGITEDVCYYLPRNTDLDQVQGLAREGERVEVEELWMGTKLKAISCLYGGLAGKDPNAG